VAFRGVTREARCAGGRLKFNTSKMNGETPYGDWFQKNEVFEIGHLMA